MIYNKIIINIDKLVAFVYIYKFSVNKLNKKSALCAPVCLIILDDESCMKKQEKK